MIKQQHPPSQAQKMQLILTKLNLKSIEQMIQSDNINVQFLTKTTNLHKSVVIKLLFQLQQLVNNPQQTASNERYTINIKEVISEWAQVQASGDLRLQRINDTVIGSSQIVEIIGRANSGKSYFSFAFILHCLRKDITVIFIDSNDNFQALQHYIKGKIGLKREQDINSLMKRVISFKFKTLSQFSVLLHNLGNQLSLQKKRPDSLVQKGVIVFIDCLSRIQMADPDTDEQNSTMDFDIIDRLKRLIVTFSTRVCSVVYTNRIPTAYTLFQTFYKNQKHRPRCKNNNSKLWDSIAAKTICVDYTRTMANHEVKRIHFTKDFSNQVFTFEK